MLRLARCFSFSAVAQKGLPSWWLGVETLFTRWFTIASLDLLAALRTICETSGLPTEDLHCRFLLVKSEWWFKCRSAQGCLSSKFISFAPPLLFFMSLLSCCVFVDLVNGLMDWEVVETLFGHSGDPGLWRLEAACYVWEGTWLRVRKPRCRSAWLKQHLLSTYGERWPTKTGKEGEVAGVWRWTWCRASQDSVWRVGSEMRLCEWENVGVLSTGGFL